MNITTIINEHPIRNWSLLCTVHKIDKWQIVDTIRSPVYIGIAYIDKVSTDHRRCRLCDTKFDLSIREPGPKFVLKLQCECGKDGKKNQTIEKLKRFLPDEDAARVFAESNIQRRKGLQNTLECWFNKGYNMHEAHLKIQEFQRSMSVKSPVTVKGVKGFSVRTKEYWIKKGYTETDAVNKVAEVQVRNGILYYEKKYGNELGKILYDERIEKWLHTYYTKDNIKEINASKGRTREQHIEDVGIEQYLLRQKSRTDKMIATLVKKGSIVDRKRLSDRAMYYSSVGYYTRISINLYPAKVNPADLEIGVRSYHVDHVFSRSHGFMLGIPPEVIGSYINLRVIPWADNIAKGPRSDYTKEHLERLYENIDENWKLNISNRKF